MRALTPNTHESHFLPDFMAKSLAEVDFARLAEVGVRFVAIDADGTLAEYRKSTIDKATKKHLLSQRKHIDGWCIASNRVTSGLDKLGGVIDAYVVPTNPLARKPRARYFRRVIEHFDTARPEEIAMIGDKLLADVWGANRAGMVSVWVEQLGDDGLSDKLFRVRQWEQRKIAKLLSKRT